MTKNMELKKKKINKKKVIKFKIIILICSFEKFRY